MEPLRKMKINGENYIFVVDNIVQTTGDSATDAMSQKAVTEALNTKSAIKTTGMREVDDSALNNGGTFQVTVIPSDTGNDCGGDVTITTPEGDQVFYHWVDFDTDGDGNPIPGKSETVTVTLEPGEYIVSAYNAGYTFYAEVEEVAEAVKIANGTGASENDVMSQKAVTDELEKLKAAIVALGGSV